VKVSVVVPARDTAATLEDALASLQAQRFEAWEAVVVDDGSQDATRAVAERVAASDPRVRVLAGAGAGVARARNDGIAAARHDALLFLDADDVLEPEALDALTGALEADPGAGVAYCGWRREAPGGAIVSVHDAETERPFDELATRCPFAIHACLARAGLVRAARGFDEALRCSEDWDLWQRIARTGTRFVRVPGVLARYRLRPGSASLDVPELLATGLGVVERGHRPDPRVAHADPRHAAGRDAARLPAARWLLLAWSAAVEIGVGGDGGAALRLARGGAGGRAALDPAVAATCFELGVPVGAVAGVARWPELWESVGASVEAALAEIEALSGTPGLARRAGRRLERAVCAHLPGAAGSARIGATQAVTVDWREPLPDLRPPAGTEVVAVRLRPAGGVVAIPVCAPVLPTWLLADAVAAQAGWEVLGAFRAARGEPGLEDFAAEIEESVAVEADGEVRLGAAVLGRLPGPVTRAQAVEAAGLELARVAVRDGVLGRPVEGGTLAERLATGVRPAPPAGGARLGRRRPGLLDGPGSRRALLPPGQAPLLAAMAGAWGEPVSPGAGAVARDPEALGAAAPAPAGAAGGRGGAPGATPIVRLEAGAGGLGAALVALRDVGWGVAALDAWLAAGRRRSTGAAPQAVLTFDADPAAFGDLAWPVLRGHGLAATVFLVTGAQDGAGWAGARALEREGVRFGAAGHSGRPLTGLSPEEAVAELAQSRLALARELRHPVCAIAYPEGEVDAPLAHLAAAVGYDCGLARRGGAAGLRDDPAALPRGDVRGADELLELLGGLA